MDALCLQIILNVGRYLRHYLNPKYSHNYVMLSSRTSTDFGGSLGNLNSEFPGNIAQFCGSVGPVSYAADDASPFDESSSSWSCVTCVTDSQSSPCFRARKGFGFFIWLQGRQAVEGSSWRGGPWLAVCVLPIRHKEGGKTLRQPSLINRKPVILSSVVSQLGVLTAHILPQCSHTHGTHI